jgi:hypothetical protein
MLEPGASQVVTLLPNGTQPRWLGSIGHVNQLTYSYINPGGCDAFSCLLQLPANLRTDALNPGRILQVRRGGGCVWDGKLQEPIPSADGWTVQGVGTGNAGGDYMAYFTTAWASAGNQNEAINRAINRGLRWTNPGNTGAPYTSGSVPSGVWFGQAVDPASNTITDLLNLFCTKGGFTWYVATQHAPDGPQGYFGNNILSVYSLPVNTLANVTRTLVASSPVPRTLGGDYNTLWLRYQSSANTATTATYVTTSVNTPASIALHQPLEAYDDLSSSGQETLGAVQAAGNNVLNRYQRASFAGPFVVRYGELLTAGGFPVDLGTDQCGQVVKVVFADYGYGGEIVPDPVIFMIGGYEYDDTAQTASITPFQSLNLNLSSMLSALSTTLPAKATRRQARNAVY